MKGIFKHCLDCGREGKDPARPIEEFYKVGKGLSQYCKVHMRDRQRACYHKKQEGDLKLPWPAPGVWPLIQPCGEKAQCRDCDGIWPLHRFNRTGNVRKDGTCKKKAFCVYCQSKYNRKYNLIKAHKKREQARQSA